MQPSSRLHESHEAFVQPHPAETHLPHPDAVLRAYGGGVGLPSERWKMDLQAQLVGAVAFVLAGMCLLATLVLLLGRWLPIWLVTLGLTAALTALGLALFASVSRPASSVPRATQATPRAPERDVGTIDEIDAAEVESVRSPEFVGGEPPAQSRLTPHPVISADGRESEPEETDGDDAKTRPLGNVPPIAPARKRLRAEMPSSTSLNVHG